MNIKENSTEKEKVAVSYSLKYLPCDEKGCPTCRSQKGHGPYWHATLSANGEQVSIFMGRRFKTLKLDKAMQRLVIKEETTQKKKVNSVSNVFPNPQNNEANLIDRIDTSKIPRKVSKPRQIKTSPPSRQDFEQDLFLLKNTNQPGKLKKVYRNLIKKYHPDQYPGNLQLNTWMSEINGQYQHRLKTGNRTGF